MTYEDNPRVSVGEAYRCFTAVQPTRGWGGPYGQHWRGGKWQCNECGHEFIGDHPIVTKRLDAHADRGHSPCEYCGRPLMRRMDGTPRQHSARYCPGKTDGHKIEREFVKNMASREFR